MDRTRDRTARRQPADPPGQRVHRRAGPEVGTDRREVTGLQRTGWGAYAVVLTGTLFGLAAALFGAPTEVAVPLIGVFFLIGALFRGVLPEARASRLAVRAKATDVVTLGLLGLLLVFGGLMLLVPREWIVG
ncbi:hypothetical protein C1I98_35380 [Spongiactinospora gelatinilytica]|uniref:DUF3017 domain-containing protein n=1 Tax=Spongiactinospora gelatinilytica TaxID=2666298 RepID=A0A2W2FIV3_9ACTN|nr:hypothetical protein C1I98_35380 [Spongiactinospora gelatinilytica]